MWLYCRDVLSPLQTAALALAALVALPACSDSDPTVTPCAPAPTPGDRLFVNGADELGVDVQHHLQTDFCDLPDTVGGTGVCLFDHDGDGDLDMYFADRAPEPNRLLRNDGGSFTDISSESGADLTTDSTGCIAFDYDGDEDLDLYVTNVGPDVLLENDGGAFRDVTAGAGIEADGFSNAATAGDIDADGDLDLFVARVVDLASCPEDACLYPPLACPVNRRNLLFINEGGTFEEVATERGIDDEAPTLVTLMFDFEGDGDVDIYVGNDMGTVFDDRLYLNDGTGNFSEAAADYDVDAPGTCTMGVDAGDFDRDGHTDMVITDFEDRPVRLFRCFDPDRPCSNEVAPDGKDAVKWGVGFVDLDNDVDLDLFVANGEVRFWEPERNFLYFNDGGGSFIEHIASGDAALTELYVSRSTAFGDIDDDGDVDIVVANAGERVQVLLNQAAAGHSLHVSLDSTAAGARVEVTPENGSPLTEPVVVGGSFASSNDHRLHFGLGDACRADVSVTYVDGETKTVTGVESGTEAAPHTVVEIRR
jgi:hypothetical protein